MGKIPENIKKLKPTQYGACEVRLIGGHYYVYQYHSKWDPEKKKPKKVTDGCIGRITEQDGFIPNSAFVLKSKKDEIHNVKIKHFGVYELFSQLSKEISKKIREFFPDIFDELIVLSLLQLVTDCSSKTAKAEFEASSLSDRYPGVSTSSGSIRSFVKKLGTREMDMDRFMKSFIHEGSKLLFDGTSIFTRASDSYAQVGYNPLHSLNPQIRLLYIFDMTSHMPVFYRMLPGNIVDRSSMITTIEQSGCKDCVIIADKGFYSKSNVSYLMSNNMKYILPLQSNTKMIPNDFDNNIDDHKYDGIFAFNDRIIWYKKITCGEAGNFTYIFRDTARKDAYDLRYVREMECFYGEETKTFEGFFENKRHGVYAFISNLDKKPEEIFLMYKERWYIEQCFDYLKNTIEIGAPYKRTKEELSGWAFLNHLSLLYFYGLLKAMRSADLQKEWTPREVISICQNIYSLKIGNETIISEIPKKTQELLNKLGVSISNT